MDLEAPQEISSLYLIFLGMNTEYHGSLERLPLANSCFPKDVFDVYHVLNRSRSGLGLARL